MTTRLPSVSRSKGPGNWPIIERGRDYCIWSKFDQTRADADRVVWHSVQGGSCGLRRAFSWVATLRSLSLHARGCAGGYCCRPADPKEMTAIENHGRVSNKAEQCLPASRFVSEIVAPTPELQGTYGSAGATTYRHASASNSHLPQVNRWCNENSLATLPCSEGLAWRRLKAIGQE